MLQGSAPVPHVVSRKLAPLYYTLKQRGGKRKCIY